MKLKYSLLLLSALSTSAFADSYNLETVVTKESQDKIIREMIATFNRGTIDTSAPITVSGSFDLNEDRKLVAINVEHVGFKIKGIPLVGTYQTDATIKASIVNGNCKAVNVTYTHVNSGSPAIVNPIFSNDLKNNAATALNIFIKNSDLNKYCVEGSSLNVSSDEISSETFDVIFY